LITFSSPGVAVFSAPTLVKDASATGDFKPYYSAAEFMRDGNGKGWVVYFGAYEGRVFLIDPVTWRYYSATLSGPPPTSFIQDGGGCWVQDWRQIIWAGWGTSGSDINAGAGGGPRLYRLQAPSNFLSGTWQWVTTDLTGTGTFAYTGSTPPYRIHVNRVRYIPTTGDSATKLFVWLARHDQPVQAFKLTQ
jgi:hypothetical protein